MSIHSLNGITLGTVDPVIIDFFQIHFARGIMHVMLVGRVARPVPAGCIDLAHEQAMRLESGLDNMVDLARCVTASADFYSNIRRRDEFSRVWLFRPAVTKCQIAV